MHPLWAVVTGKDRKITTAEYRALRHAAAAADAKTAATILVIVRTCSGNYRDIDYLAGAVLAWLGLVFVLFTPPVYSHWLVPIELALLFAAGAWLCAVTPLRRWLTTARRRARQVRVTAEAVLVEHGLLHTPGRLGVLLYWSLLERRVEIIADVGVRTAVPAAEWNARVFDLRRVEGALQPVVILQDQIAALGDLLAQYLPATIDSVNPFPRPRESPRVPE
jgi:putative membrane protein